MLRMRVTGLEPAFLTEIEPKSIVSANFTIPAYVIHLFSYELSHGSTGSSNIIPHFPFIVN